MERLLRKTPTFDLFFTRHNSGTSKSGLFVEYGYLRNSKGGTAFAVLVDGHVVREYPRIGWARDTYKELLAK